MSAVRRAVPAENPRVGSWVATAALDATRETRAFYTRPGEVSPDERDASGSGPAYHREVRIGGDSGQCARQLVTCEGLKKLRAERRPGELAPLPGAESRYASGRGDEAGAVLRNELHLGH